MSMKTIVSILIAAVALLLMDPAPAQQLQKTTSCVGGYSMFSCITIWGAARDPYIRTVPEGIRDQERDREWVAYCRPKIFRDRYGVARYRYAAAQCEFGIIDPGVRVAR